MVVITMTNCPSKLRGDLTKWMCEINIGVYVGQVNARVREALWKRVCENIKDGQATMVYSSANEQHFEFRTHNTVWQIRDFDGIKLMMRPNSSEQSRGELPQGFSNASKRMLAGKRRNNKIDTDSEWAFLDIETTGLNLESDKIIEMAVLVANRTKIKSTWSALIRIDTSIPSQITELTKITDEMLCSSRSEIDSALQQLNEIIKERTVVCFNRKFDIGFLQNEYKRRGLVCLIGKVIDVLPIARKRIMDVQNYKLGSLAEYFDIPYEIRHRALEDCEILYKVFLKLNEI